MEDHRKLIHSRCTMLTVIAVCALAIFCKVEVGGRMAQGVLTVRWLASFVHLLLDGCISPIQTAESRPHIRHQRDGSHCSRCGPGWGVISRCARGRDTECGKCLVGTYSPHHSTQPCWNCARCGPGLYEAHPCTSRTDTVCDSCHRPAPENPDYRRKCKGRARLFLAPEDAQDTGEESVLVNGPSRQLEFNDREEILAKDVEAIMRDEAIARSDNLRRI